MKTQYPFRKTRLYELGCDYLDEIYRLAENLNSRAPSNLRDQILQAATHIVVNIAGKSSGKTDIEQSFLVDGCLMSLFETIACLDIIERQKFAKSKDLKKVREKSDLLFNTLESMKKVLKGR